MNKDKHIENQMTRCVHKGFREINQDENTVKSICNKCGRIDKSEFPSISKAEDGTLKCATHSTDVLFDFFGIFCPFCLIEEN